MTQQQDRTRIFSHITRSRFLHVEDSLDIGKIRFFIGEYKKGAGASATAYHFLDVDDARPLMADLSWARQLDITDYKGSSNGAGGPVSRVLKVKGPKDGKFWIEVQNGPGQVIGAGAVKPAGEPDASISIALTTYEARKLALAVIEYMAAWRLYEVWRVKALCSPPPTPKVTGSTLPNKTPMASRSPSPMPKVEGGSAAADTKALFGSKEPAQAQDEPPADNAPAFFRLVNKALASGILDHDGVATRIKAPGSWREKGLKLQAAMSG